VVMLGVAQLKGAHFNQDQLLGAMLFLVGLALAVGLAATIMAARSVADPVATVGRALERVEQGDFDTEVPVDDGSEVGLLQAGFNRMAAGLAERERMRDLFGRHVGDDVARAALDGEVRLGGEVREVGVLFLDIVGSTSLAAERPPEEVVALLNALFAIVVEVTEAHNGLVNKFEGDAALCVFGAPTSCDDPAGDALCAGRELRDRLRAGVPDVDYGIGVSFGAAVAGNVGAERRFEYTVIGDPVNEGARLCELAKKRPERLLASEAALRSSGDGEANRWALGEAVTLRGRPEATRLATVPA
jgi:adenylate cyclase